MNTKLEATRAFVFVAFLLIIAVSAEVDYFWVEADKPLTFIFLFGALFPMTALFSYFSIKVAKAEEHEKVNEGKKAFIFAVIGTVILSQLHFVLYLIATDFFSQPPFRNAIWAYAISITTIVFFMLMSLCPATFPRPKTRQLTSISAMILMVTLPFFLLVGYWIIQSWANPAWGTPGPAFMEKIMYWTFFWGYLMPVIFLTLAFGWKMGGGGKRQSFNIAFAGILMQYSFLEDILFYALNGRVTDWASFLNQEHSALANFPIAVEWFFNKPSIEAHLNTIELFIWLTVMVTIALAVLFDVHGRVYDRLKKK